MVEDAKRLPWGYQGVDWQERIDFQRLRKERLARAQASMKRNGIAVMIASRGENKRYCSGVRAAQHTGAGESCAIIFAESDDVIVYEESATYNSEKEHVTWVKPENYRYTPLFLGGAVGRSMCEREGKRLAQEMCEEFKKRGLLREKIAADHMFEWTRTALTNLGIQLVDGRQTMEEARRVKTPDEINCLKMAGAIVDIAWAQVIEKMRPGMRETEIGAVAMEAVWKNGIEATGLPAVRSGPNTAPNYLGRSPQDRIVQPGDLVFIDLWGVTYMGYRTCYYRTFKVGTKPSAKEKDLFKKCREYLYRGVEQLKAGNTTADVARAWPSCHELGYANEFLAADSAIGHNIGLVQYEPPIIARMNSIEDPMVLEAGMTIAMETWAGEPGIGGCRLENVYLVTEKGCENLYAMPDMHIIVPPHSIYDSD